ncbi:MAG: HNH endonuclease, partial [Propionibacteriaceae bacterium]
MGAVGLVVLAGCTPSTSTDSAAVSSSASAPGGTTSSSSPTETSSSAATPETSLPASAELPPGGAQTAVAVLATLPVKGRAPKTGYSREQFGDGWVDTDRNGCDSRNDVLARDLSGETFKPGTRDCVVATGTLADPYSGKAIVFTRGQDTSSAVQIDHVVALSDAWQKGAQQWDAAKRVAFANDGLELLAVDGPLNGQKSDGDAATWLPPNRGYRCTYVARQVGLKATWGLWVTAAERDAIAGVLAACPGELVPSDPAVSTGSGTETGVAAEARPQAGTGAGDGVASPSVAA